MRITSGIYKSRLIKFPAGIRPTQDKARKAVFDILGDIEGLSFLELFAGSGAVGLEALSRGAKEAVLVENGRECLPVIKQNIDALKITNCTVYPLEAGRAIENLHNRKKTFDIIFLDPPYYQDETPCLRSGPADAGFNDTLAKKALQMLDAYDILAPYGLVVVQHFKKDKLQSQCLRLELIKEAEYGNTVLSFYRKKQG